MYQRHVTKIDWKSITKKPICILTIAVNNPQFQKMRIRFYFLKLRADPQLVLTASSYRFVDNVIALQPPIMNQFLIPSHNQNLIVFRRIKFRRNYGIYKRWIRPELYKAGRIIVSNSESNKIYRNLVKATQSSETAAEPQQK